MGNANLKAATEALETAAAFAEDGGLATAIERAEAAIIILRTEQRRRTALMEAAGASLESRPRLVRSYFGKEKKI